MALANPTVHSWQFNGVAPFIDIVRWCNTNLDYDTWGWKNETIYFNSSAVQTMFLLRWGG